MSAQILPIKGPVQQNERRALFMQHTAESFDKYVTDYGCEPEAILSVMGGAEQTCRLSYQTTGPSEGLAMTLKCVAAMVIMKDVIAPGASA